MRVKTLIYDWHHVGSTEDAHGMGEDYRTYECGKGGVKSITESDPSIDKMPLNYFIETDDGCPRRVFNPNHVTYFETKKLD